MSPEAILCLQNIYSGVRKSSVDASLRKLWIEKLSIGDIQRVEQWKLWIEKLRYPEGGAMKIQGCRKIVSKYLEMNRLCLLYVDQSIKYPEPPLLQEVPLFLMESGSTSEQNPINSQIRELLRDNIENFIQFLRTLLSKDEAIRATGLSLCVRAAIKFTQPFACRLCYAIRASSNTETTLLCCKVACTFLKKKWKSVDQRYQARFKEDFVQLLNREEKWESLKEYCKIVEQIANLTFPDWAELQEFMSGNLYALPSTTKSVASITLFRKLIPKFPGTFSPYADDISLEFEEIMEVDVNNRVRIAAVGAAAMLMLHLSIPLSNHTLLTAIINTLGGTVSDEDLVCDALDAMGLLARGKPWLLGEEFTFLAESVIKILSDGNSTKKMRLAAVEFFVRVSDDGIDSYELVKTMGDNLIKMLLTQLLQMLMCMDGISATEADVCNVDAGKTNVSHYAENSLKKLARVLGLDSIMQNVPIKFVYLFADFDWKKRYAAVTALRVVAPTFTSSMVLLEDLKYSLVKTTELIRDQHALVCWTAIRAILEISTYLSPLFQDKYHEEVVAALSVPMDESANPIVQMYAMLAMSIFCKKSVSVLKLHLEKIINKLPTFLKIGNTFLKETALSELASLADLPKAWRRICMFSWEKFHPYMMPLLIKAAKLEDDLMDRDLEEIRIVSKKILLASNAIMTFMSIETKGLHLWTEQVLTVVQPHLKFQFNDEVRIAAISVMPLLLRSALENERSIPDSVDSPIITLARIIIPALVEALEAPTIKLQVQALVALNRSMQIAKTWAPDNDEIIGNIWKVSSAWFDRRFYRKEERENAEKYSLEPVNEEIQEENNVCSKASVLLPFELNEVLICNYLLTTSMFLQQKYTTPEERRMAFDIFHFIAEEFREQGLRPYAKYIPFLFEACRDTVPDIQQIAARAIGIYVEFDRETFKQHLRDGLSSLEFILQHTDKHRVKEAAICAYGKVCFFLCGEEINLYEDIGRWLVHLPIRHWTNEAKTAHEILCSIVEKLKADYPYITQTIPIIVEILWIGKKVAEEETLQKMIQQLKDFPVTLSHTSVSKLYFESY
nr:importin-5-like [Ipomoea batatas]